MEMPVIDEREFDQTDAIIEEKYIRVNKRNIKSIHFIQFKYNDAPEIDTLSEYIRSKNKWHYQITNNTKIFHETELISPIDKMTISTDGGASNGKGSFGVVKTKRYCSKTMVDYHQHTMIYTHIVVRVWEYSVDLQY
jgi:hypothetical protein